MFQIRAFLVKLFSQYKIYNDVYTRVALVTYDQWARVEFFMNEHTDWTSLYYALGNKWQYGPATNHTSIKNLTE